MLSQSTDGVAARKTAGTAYYLVMLLRWGVLFSKARRSQRVGPTASHLSFRRSSVVTGYILQRSLVSLATILIGSWSVMPHLRIRFQSQSYIGTDDQSASLSWCQTPIWGPQQMFLLLSLRVCRYGRPLWRKVGSVDFSCCWTSLAQSFSGLGPAGPITIFYCLNSPVIPPVIGFV
jgi:hypothetical protein